MNNTQRAKLEEIVNKFNEKNDVLFQVEHLSRLFSNVFCGTRLFISYNDELIDLINALRNALIISGEFTKITNIIFSATGKKIEINFSVF